MKKLPPDFRRQKGALALWILGLGLGAAGLWALGAGLIFAKGYPQNALLGLAGIRFNDFTDNLRGSTLPNPYDEPFMNYPPTAYLLFRLMSFSDRLSLILVYFFSLTALALLLAWLLRPIVAGAWSRVSLAFLLLPLSYPVLYGLDRGNIEILLAPFIGWAPYFYHRRRDVEGTACLFPAICLKLYPALLLVLLLRRRKAGLAILCGFALLLALAASSFLFPATPGMIWSSYQQNLQFYRDWYVLGNEPLEGSASLWNAYKIVLIALQKLEIISPVNFGFDGPFILASYHLYSIAFALFALICAGYAWLGERHMPRSILMLLLLLSIAAPSGPDYRLIYASLALGLLVLLPQPRPGDWTALVLIALAVVPKKEILLTFVGKTETGYTDVPIQALLNPVLILVAMIILLHQSRPLFARPRAAARLRDLAPSRWRWI